jgi:hypothetical protein
MSGFRCIRVQVKCFLWALLIVEHFPQIVCGIAGMFALFMAFSQKRPPEVAVRLFHECVLGSVVGRFCTLGTGRLLRK